MHWHGFSHVCILKGTIKILACMWSLMPGKFTVDWKGLVTLPALIWSLLTVYSQMHYEVTVSWKWIITLATVLWFLFSPKYALKSMLSSLCLKRPYNIDCTDMVSLLCVFWSVLLRFSGSPDVHFHPFWLCSACHTCYTCMVCPQCEIRWTYVNSFT